jgi:hypothetical protein
LLQLMIWELVTPLLLVLPLSCLLPNAPEEYESDEDFR